MDAYAISSPAEFPNLRLVVAPEFAALPAPALAAHIDRLYGEGAAEEYEEYLEGFFDDIGRGISSAVNTVANVARQAAPAIAKVGGGALQGALSGSSLGLPGIIGGAVLGGAGAGLSAYGKGAAHDIGGVLSGVTNIAGQFSPMGQLGGALGSAVSGLAGGGGRGAAGAAVNALGGLLGGPAGGALNGGGGALGALNGLFGGGGATGQLLSLLQRPEVGQALAALNLGPAGRRNIPVGSAQTPVPVSAITSLIGQLANQASAEAMAIAGGGEGPLEYMMGESGDYIGDPASPRDRAAALWNVLNNAQAERVVGAMSQTLGSGPRGMRPEAFDRWEPGEADFEMDMAELSEVASEDFFEWEEDYESV
jgi:hypothetical protein